LEQIQLILQQIHLFLRIKVDSYNIVFKIAKKKIRSLKLEFKRIFSYIFYKSQSNRNFAVVIKKVMAIKWQYYLPNYILGNVDLQKTEFSSGVEKRYIYYSSSYIRTLMVVLSNERMKW
jgi:hypothetical protein